MLFLTRRRIPRQRWAVRGHWEQREALHVAGLSFCLSCDKAMIERSQKIIKSATLSKIRMKRPGEVSVFGSVLGPYLDLKISSPCRMMRFGREDFGRDSPWQWNRPGRMMARCFLGKVSLISAVRIDKMALWIQGRRAFRMRVALSL